MLSEYIQFKDAHPDNPDLLDLEKGVFWWAHEGTAERATIQECQIRRLLIIRWGL